MAKKGKNKISKFPLVYLILVLISIVCLALLHLKYKNFNPISNNQALVGFVPNFDNLSLNDLPNFSDFRDIHYYDDRVIVIGVNRIAEYDKSTNKFVRVNDPKVLGCIYDSTKIGDYLYVSCNPHYPGDQQLGKAKTVIASKIYQIDLKSGKTVKEYFGDEVPVDPNLDFAMKTPGIRTNLELGSKGNILYMRSWDGIEKMDTKTGKVSKYSLSNGWNRTAELDGTGLGIPIGLNSPIKSPEFKSISPLLHDKYYILADDGLYTLTESNFPQRIISTDVVGESFKSAILNDSKQVVFIGFSFWFSSTNGIYIYLADINKNEIIKLSKVSEVSDDTIEKVFSKIEKGYFEKNGDIVVLKDGDSNSVLLSIDLKKQKLNISK